MKYHIHVYKVSSKAEIDIKAVVASKAMKKALAALKKVEKLDSIFGKSDCKYIAIAFRSAGGGLLETPQRG